MHRKRVTAIAAAILLSTLAAAHGGQRIAPVPLERPATVSREQTDKVAPVPRNRPGIILAIDKCKTDAKGIREREDIDCTDLLEEHRREKTGGKSGKQKP